MSNATSEPVTRDAIARFNDRLRLARASELAHAGRFIEAEALILVRGNRSGHDAYDLLARIQVRMGDLKKAKALWGKSLETGGNEEKIRACLAALADHQDRVFKRRVLLPRLMLSLWILLMCFAAWMYTSFFLGS